MRQRHAPRVAPGLPGGLERMAGLGLTEELVSYQQPEAPKKRKSNSKKGADIENRAKEQLEAEGFLVHRCIRTPVNRGGQWYSNSNDVFNVFDLVAVRVDHPTRFIQVTVKSQVRERMRKVVHVARQVHLVTNCEVWGFVEKTEEQAGSFEVWLWFDGQFRRIVDGELSGIGYAPP